MNDIKTISLKERPSFAAGPARISWVIINDRIKNNCDSAILDQMLMLLTSNILAYHSFSTQIFHYLYLYSLCHRIKFIEPYISHLASKSIPIASILILLNMISTSHKYCYILGCNNPTLGLSWVGHLYVFTIGFQSLQNFNLEALSYSFKNWC